MANNGKALSFDGNDDYVLLPDGIVSSLTNFTIETWFLVNNSNTWQRVFDFGTGTGVNMFFTTVSASGLPRFAITVAGGNNEERLEATGLSGTLQTGVWHHLAITLHTASTTGTMYIDGVQVGQNTAMTLTPASLGVTTQSYLGKSQYNDPYFNGSIDEFRIWNTAKTLTIQIQASMGELTGNEAGLLAYYNFNASAGTTLANKKTNTLNGTLNNFDLIGISSNWSTYNQVNITGVSAVCVGSQVSLSNDAGLTGGVWSSLNNRARVNASGVVTGSNAGSASIAYKYTAGGCNVSTTTSITINPNPNVPNIAYAAGTINPQYGAGGNYCTNRTFTVVGSPATGGGAVGVWSKTGVITVNATTGLLNTGNTPGAASLTYTYTNAAGCSNSRTISSSIVGCGSRSSSLQSTNDLQPSAIDFVVYPNPAKNIVSLNVETLIGSGQIIITNLYGKQVKTQTLSMGINTINVANLAKGMYFVSMITSEGKTTKKLVVE